MSGANTSTISGRCNSPAGRNALLTADQTDKIHELHRLVSTNPIDWPRFLDLDEDLNIFAHEETFHLSLSLWLLSQYPPPPILTTILKRYKQLLFHDELKIKECLNAALFYSATEAVKFFATHYKHVIGQPFNDGSGDFPIHRARKAEIASILLHSFPPGICARNKVMDIPLHEAIRHYQNPDYIRFLILYGKKMYATGDVVGDEWAGGGILVMNQWGESPFDILQKQIAAGIDIASLSSPVYQTDRRLWINLTTMILAIQNDDPGYSIQEEGTGMANFNILHKIIALGCPSEAIQLGHTVMPQQTKVPDADGRYPLALASSRPRTCSRRVLNNLLQAFPQAAHRFDRKGRYPLHYCAIGGRTFSDGAEIIYAAEPLIASIPDRDGFVPFMLAASARDGSVDTVYRLLRNCPDTLYC